MHMTGERVHAARFAVTKFREGYEMDQVDDFLDRIATALDVAAEGGVPSLSVDDVLEMRFTATKYREGYDQDQVDDFLDQVIRTMRADPAIGPHQTGGPVDGATVRQELARLQPARMRAGYDPAAVTEHLTAAAHALDHRARGFRPSLTADDVARVQLPRTWWRPGYDRTRVNALLERVVATLRS